MLYYLVYFFPKIIDIFFGNNINFNKIYRNPYDIPHALIPKR